MAAILGIEINSCYFVKGPIVNPIDLLFSQISLKTDTLVAEKEQFPTVNFQIHNLDFLFL